ncbi:MAG: L,D-transpeptidase [Litoreibacter sp.]|nr:L,D-transpeptidase [Litoreibacter sp.]
MPDKRTLGLSRRNFLLSASVTATTFALPACAQNSNSTEMEGEISAATRRNMSSFRSLEWEPYFSNLRNGAILVDIDSRALHMWTEDGSYALYPSSVPVSEDLTRRGRTSVVRKVEGPSWSPTPAMKIRNPEWPDFVGPGPDNPLGTHALYLGWTYYRIHGTQDTRKIGRRSSNGCIGLYNEHIAKVFEEAKVGTQVLLI